MTTSKLDRRQFARLALGAAVASMLTGCRSFTTPQATATSISVATRSHTPTPSRPMLHNENAPGFYVRYYKPFEAIDPARWELAVEGLVENPQRLSLSNVLALPRISQVSRMKCVECWSAAAKWEGFHLRSLLELVTLKPEATWLHLYCADGYYEALNLEALMRDRVLFVHHMNDEILPNLYGAPLRLMISSRYGYKSAKALVRLEFASEEKKGYWSSVAPYTPHGNIKRGKDHPLDLEGTRQINGGAEIFYPDGIESQGQPGTSKD